LWRLLPFQVFGVDLGVHRANLLYEVSQIAQMTFPVGHLLIDHHAVKPLFRRLRQQLFGDGDMLFCGEPQTVNQQLHLGFGFLDSFANLNFLFPGQQGHFAHLVHVHANRIVQHLKAGIFFFLRFGWFGAFHLGVVDYLNIQSAQLGIQLIQILRRQALRQHIVDVIVSDVAVLMSQMQ
jgi:hypothetical protein